MVTSRRAAPSIRTRSTRFAAGAQTRKRTDPSGDPTAPHRRAGPPCLVSFIKTAFRLFDPGASGPTNSPRGSGSPTIRIRVGQPSSAAAFPTQRATACSPAGSWPLVTPVITLVGQAGRPGRIECCAGAAWSRPRSSRNGRRPGRRRHSAGGRRRARTGSLRSYVDTAWQVRLSHAAGEARAGQGSRSISGPWPDPPPMCLTDRRFLSCHLGSMC